MMELWVICQPLGFGVLQVTFPVGRCSATMSALPPGAMMALLFSMSGHCPAYHVGTRVPYSATRSFFHTILPLLASQHMTWPIGPSVTT